MEDADGGHIVDTCFEELSAEITHLARALYATQRQSAFSIYTKINTRVGFFLDFSSLGQLYMLQTSFLSSKGEKINCLSNVSCYCKLLCCQSSNIVNWPLMNLSQHCLAAALSKTSYCFCFWGFLSRSCSHCHSGGSFQCHQLTSHDELRPIRSSCSLHIFVHITWNAQMSCILVSRGRVCVYVLACGSGPCVEGPGTQVEENWNRLRNSVQSKHKSRTSSGNYSRLESHLLSL